MTERFSEIQAPRSAIQKLRGLGELRPEAIEALLLAAEEGDAEDSQVMYLDTEPVRHLYVVLAGRVRLDRVGRPARFARWAGPGEAFGSLTGGKGERATSDGAAMLLRIPAEALLDVLAREEPERRDARAAVLRGAIVSALSAAESVSPQAAPTSPRPARSAPAAFAGRAYKWLLSPRFYRNLLGYALFFGGWYLFVEVWALPRFDRLPGITQVVREWISPDPTFGLSLYTPEYYAHILSSLRRVGLAFALATALGIPVGLAFGASTTFREYLFPIFELFRPVPIPAWIPLAILVFSGTEAPIIFLTFLASFFATALNTFLGVRSIDPKYVLAARCLGASSWQVFREIIVPGALPYMLTGLQVAVGVAWFSIAAAEMCSGQFGLGYIINTAYTMVQYPTIVIGMLTLGVLGFATSALVRLVGERLTVWRARELAMESS